MARMHELRSESLQTLQSFGDISRFLREGVAGEESRQMRESVGALAQAIDAAVRARRSRRDAAHITRLAAALAQCVREHQFYLTSVDSAWHSLYEFGVYQNALRELRKAVDAWHKTLETRSSREGESFDRMELLAWRTLGEGMLLIDMHDQGEHSDAEPAIPHNTRATGPWARVLAWWHRVRR